MNIMSIDNAASTDNIRITLAVGDIKGIFSSDRAACIIVDKNLRVIFANSAYKKLLGVDPKIVIGKKITDFEPLSISKLVLDSGIPSLFQPWRLNSLKNLPVTGSALPLKWQGKTQGVLCVFTPDKKMIYDAFNNLRSRLSYTKNVLLGIDDFAGTGPAAVPHSGREIIGNSTKLVNAVNISTKVSKKNCNILLTGESGVGKELFAKFIHANSTRKNGPFVAVNCAAIPEGLLESELFGYAGGAFSGASRTGKIGKFELANKGTLFLDEVGDMPFNLQAKLLRVISEKQVDRVGGTSPIPIDVRIISATNKDLKDLIARGQFRQDLYYRLATFPVSIPSLAERKEDIPDLIDYFAGKYCSKKPDPVISRQALALLMDYSWPGNIRELENVIQYAFVLSDESTIQADHLPAEVTEKGISPDNTDFVNINTKFSLNELKQELEHKAILKALKESNYNKQRACRMLGIARRTLYLKAKEYNILI